MIHDILNESASLVFSLMPEIQSGRYKKVTKPDGSFVTEADLLVEQRLRNYLVSKLPELIFIGEESFDFEVKNYGGFVAILDPIDGTENFCSGMKEWGTSLCIFNGSRHLGSLLLMPELGERLITGDVFPKLNSRITGFSSSYHDDIANGLKLVDEYRVTGCAVYNLFNVIRGSFARFVNPKGAYVWDLMPGLMLALEHGCNVLINDEPYHGQFLDPTQKYRVDIQHRYDLHSR